MSTTTSLYNKQELISLYREAVQNHKDSLVRVLSPASLVPFCKIGFISEEQKSEWSVANVSKKVSRTSLIETLLGRSAVEDYIKFSRCLQFINGVEAKRIFPFITDLFAVGLHDPISKQGRFTAPSTSVMGVLWL